MQFFHADVTLGAFNSREELRLCVFENRVPRNISEPMRGEVT
jgi:hypothetical protein